MEKKIWSLKIPIKKNIKDKEIQKFFYICKNKLGLIPNIIRTNSIDKKKFDAFNIFYNRLMQDDNYLSKIEKEMIAVVVSSINRCLYCCVSHGFTLGKLLKNNTLAKNILINYTMADISKKHKEMLNFVNKLTLNSHNINDDDRNKLRKIKFNEYQILEIIEIASFFNMTNRVASGTGMIPNKEYYI
tara:strand:+ start:304 stop:864 length:561 start_codon:yes stop_codon:yes gene_type:complete